MKHHTVHSTFAYTLRSDRFGNYTLTRNDLFQSRAYFQGDDARLWEQNMDALYHARDYGDEFDKVFDFLCSGYDDILEVTPE